MTRDEFVHRITRAAKAVRAKGGPINVRGTVAHAANESGWGKSGLTRDARNLFGIKKGRSWTGDTITLPTWEVIDGANVTVNAEFRSYPDFEASVWDYARLIERLYPHAAASKDSTAGFLYGLFKAGRYRWATDPRAFDKVLTIAEGLTLPEDAPTRGEVEVLRLNHFGRGDRWRLLWSLLTDDVPTLRGRFAFGRHPLAEGPGGHKLDVSKMRK